MSDSTDASPDNLAMPEPQADESKEEPSIDLSSLPDELRDAVQAMIEANSLAELLEQIGQYPVLLTPQATAAIDTFLEESQKAGQDDAVSLINERYKILKQVIKQIELVGQPIPDDLAELLRNWINTDTWDESQEFLKAHTERLLSDEAFAAMDVLLARNAGEDEGIIKTLLQHRAILEKARAETIDAAYAELLKLSPFNVALNALLQAAPAKLEQAITEHPMLLEEETLNGISALIANIEQDGNLPLAQGLRLRLNEVRRIRQQREQATRRSSSDRQDRQEDGGRDAEYRGTEFHATQGGIAAQEIDTLNQINIENYTPPGKQWQSLKRRAFRKAFVGRQDKVDELLKYLIAGENVAIAGELITAATLQGMGGIGKTYLAHKLAIELQDRFPGRIIWIDVGPDVTDEKSAQVPLRSLAGCAFGGIPPIGQLHPEQVAAWLEETAPGRLLVIFDDVWNQVPLSFLSRALPASAIRLVTTRYANVAQVTGGKMVTLGRLVPQDGLALLEDRLGCQGNMTYRGDLEALVTLLDGHALALDIAAARIKKPARMRSILQDLQQGIGRGELDGLELPPSEERDENLEKSLALSYERMTPEQQKHFRTLGVFAAETPITPEAAAAIWGMEDLNTTENALFDLVDLALLTEMEEAGVIYYRQHGLLQVYAHALLEKENELTGASWAHAQYYTDLVERTEIAEYSLLDQHTPNLLAALQWSADNEPSLFSQLLEGSRQFLLVWGQSVLLEEYLPKAVTAADATGNKGRQANLLQSLGDLERRLGNIDQARAAYDAALPLCRAERDRLGEANVLQSLGDLESRLGNLDQARAAYDAALPLFRSERDRLGEGHMLASLGDLESRLGNLEQARTAYDAALPLFQEVRNRLGEANLLRRLGDLESRLGNIDQARAAYDAALPLYRAERARLGEANLLRSLGELESRLGNIDQARAAYDAALPLYRSERARLGEANLLQSLGDLERRLGNIDQARAHYDAALPLFRAERDRLGEANLYMSLGDMFLAKEDWAQARTYYEQALPLFVAERDPLGQANTLIDLGLVRFELGEHKQGMQDVQQAAALFHSVQDVEWTHRAESRLAEMQVRLEHPEADVVLDFARADWADRRQLLTEHADLLLDEQVEPIFDTLVAANPDSDAVRALEGLRTLLRRCRAWSVDAVFYFELHMRLGDGIDIPSKYEPAVMQVATLLSQQDEDKSALEQAIEMMESLLNRLIADTPPLFEAALLRDLAEAMQALPSNHPTRKIDQIEMYYREALPQYLAAERSISVAFIQRSLGDVLSEQGRYEEALEPLQVAIQGLQAQEDYKSEGAWALSSYASALDKLGRTEEALIAYAQAITLLPDTPALLRNRAETLIHARRLNEAEAELARAVELDGNEDSPYLWVRRAQLAVARGDGALAGQMLDELLKRSPTEDVMFLRAQSAWLRGDLSAAQEGLRRAFGKANAGERTAMRRELERLISEHPDLAGLSEVGVL